MKKILKEQFSIFNIMEDTATNGQVAPVERGNKVNGGAREGGMGQKNCAACKKN